MVPMAKHRNPTALLPLLMIVTVNNAPSGFGRGDLCLETIWIIKINAVIDMAGVSGLQHVASP